MHCKSLNFDLVIEMAGFWLLLAFNWCFSAFVSADTARRVPTNPFN